MNYARYLDLDLSHQTTFNKKLPKNISYIKISLPAYQYKKLPTYLTQKFKSNIKKEIIDKFSAQN